MQSMMHPQAEWISTATRRSSATTATHHPRHHDQQCQRQHDDRDDDSAVAQEVSNPHRGSGGLVRGRAVFCLPPTAGWFQGHFAYAARGGCTASLGVLGTELPVDACMQCCHGGFSRFKVVFIHHESGKEATLVVERYGGNMMCLHAEPIREGDGVGGGGGSASGSGRGGEDHVTSEESDFAFQTHVMKADDDARPLLDRYFQAVVRAAADPAELRECIVCIGPMDVPLSLLHELAAPIPDGARTQSMVCSAFGPCREGAYNHPPQPTKHTPLLSPAPPSEVDDNAVDNDNDHDHHSHSHAHGHGNGCSRVTAGGGPLSCPVGGFGSSPEGGGRSGPVMANVGAGVGPGGPGVNIDNADDWLQGTG